MYLVETEAEGFATVRGNLSSTIPGRTRTETYAYGFVVEFYKVYTYGPDF